MIPEVSITLGQDEVGLFLDTTPDGKVSLRMQVKNPASGFPSAMWAHYTPDQIDLIVEGLLARKAEALAVRQETLRAAIEAEQEAQS